MNDNVFKHIQFGHLIVLFCSLWKEFSGVISSCRPHIWLRLYHTFNCFQMNQYSYWHYEIFFEPPMSNPSKLKPNFQLVYGLTSCEYPCFCPTSRQGLQQKNKEKTINMKDFMWKQQNTTLCVYFGPSRGVMDLPIQLKPIYEMIHINEIAKKYVQQILEVKNPMRVVFKVLNHPLQHK